MKPLFHPAMDDVTVGAILHALSDPVRVAILTQIVGSDCPRNCSNFLCVNEKNIPKSTLSQHFRVLREAGLIRGERSGVEMRNVPRCAEIEKRFPGLLAAIIKAHSAEAASKKRPSARRAVTTSAR